MVLGGNKFFFDLANNGHFKTLIETLKLHEMLKFYTTENKPGIVEDITYDFFPSHHNIIWFCSTHIFKSS